MYRFTVAIGFFCVFALNQAHGVVWNGTQEALTSINLFEIQKSILPQVCRIV